MCGIFGRLDGKNDCEMATTDSVFTTRNRIQNDTDNIRICSKEQAMADILYVNIPLGPWNKIYTTSVIRKHHYVLIFLGLERGCIFL